MFFKKKDKELEALTARCPYCGGEIMDFMPECPHCHQPLPMDTEELKHDRRLAMARNVSIGISVICFIVIFVWQSIHAA